MKLLDFLTDVLLPITVGALLAFAVYQGILNAKQGQAICTLRGDLEKRVDSTRDFLRTHPRGFAGVPAAALRKSVADQRRTIRALSPVSC